MSDIPTLDVIDERILSMKVAVRKLTPKGWVCPQTAAEIEARRILGELCDLKYRLYPTADVKADAP